MKLTITPTRAVALLASASLVPILVSLPSTANAATATFAYGSYAGGTKIEALGTTITSDLTAQSAASGVAAQSSTNNLAKVNVASLVSVGAITTDVTGSSFGDGTQVVAHAKTVGVSLLNGLIKADVIETTARTSASSTSSPDASSNTTVLGLVIAGKKYPVNLPPNTTIGIPGIATVTINATATSKTKDGSIVVGDGVLVTLLKARGAAAAGATIAVNPVLAMESRAAAAKDGRPVAGRSYGTYVYAHVGDAVKAESGRTAPIGVGAIGTEGKTITNATARVRLPWVLDVAAVHTSGEGIQSPVLSEVTQTAGVASLNLFSGLITAKAIGAKAFTQRTGAGTTTNEGSLEFINLRIAGKAIPIDVSPNTSINVANLGRVTINEQTPTVVGNQVGMKVIGLHIVLDTARAGLPVGAEIEVAVAQTLIY